MASIRSFKKGVYSICGDIATDTLIASELFPQSVNKEDVDRLINEIAALQEDTIALTSISFDKARREFANPADYRKAKHAYFKKAYAKLEKDFLDRVGEILKQLNEALPAEARKAALA